MPQSNLFLPAISGGKNAPLVLDAQTGQLLLISSGGISTKLNVTTQTVLKATPGRFTKIVINAPGATSGGWALNDCSTTAAIAASNLVWQLAFGATTNVAGAIFVLDFPFQNGIVLSVPGGSPIASVSFA
jgi:hypothetical protein